MSYNPTAVPTNTVSTTRTINTTSPIAGGGDLSTDRTLTHATSGVGAGTYTSVTVDTKGHVTGGTNPTATVYRDISAFRDTGGGTMGAVHWYTANHVDSDAYDDMTLTANRLYAVPFIAPARGGTLDRIAVYVSAAVPASVVRLGIYSNNNTDSTIYPGSLLLDASTVASTSTGAKTLTISQALTASSLYWLVAVSGHGPDIRSLPATACTAILGSDGAFGTASSPYTHIRATFTLAALPATFTHADVTSPALIKSAAPAIAVRFSA